ncbi:MAG: uracil-DNA glycosylase family protein [Neisseria sp.]|uniref:uracil-DNA glycosylase family protein n=1 Tax=Neisseria sp. TaxID=192066 RepID=UPI0026DAD592|nr:uracil-DNA glycosylase family protein [Neisseria sp.]MDO4641483.1 uracil-DNA glycosylase family protein [Neisseria sp.]
MLSSRYLHLHEALGLGPMWLKQGACILPDGNDTKPAATNAAPVSEPPSQAPAPVSAQTPPAAATPLPRQTPPAPPVSSAHAATLASLGLKTMHQKVQETSVASEPAPKPTEPQHSNNTVEHYKQALSDKINPAKLMVVSICPSPEDSVAGRLFCGQVGTLLNNMLSAIGLVAEESHLTSWLDATEFNPNPDATHLLHALPRIRAELELAEPQAILFLGQFFTAPEQAPIMKQLCGELPVFNIPHPARLLRYPQQKAEAWAELKKLRTALSKR